MKTKKTLTGLYSLPGFRALNGLKGIMSDPETRIIKLKRRQKKQFVRVAEELVAAITIQSFIGFEIWLQRAPGYSWSSNTGDYIAGIANQ